MSEVLLHIFSLFGGVALFLYGMELVRDGLQDAAGFYVRMFLHKITSNRVLGLLGGTAIATAIQSGATTVMTVGFINAGMVTLTQSVPLILGANVGTTLSMQLVAFNLSRWAPAAIAFGMPLRMFCRREVLKNFGTVLLGFGLLFVGLAMMKEPLPFVRESELARSLASQVSVLTISGALLGIAISVATTSIFMSSGATIAVIFALLDQKVLTSFEQAFPMLLGAHVGTCVITLLSSVGTSINARRAAFAHLGFNVIGGIIAMVMVKFYLWIIPQTSPDPIRQVANAHTLVQLINAMIFLPFSGLYARAIELMTPSDEQRELSYLDPELLKTPEMAIMAAIKELRRQTRLAQKMLQQALEATLAQDLDRFDPVLKDEEAVDEIKRALDQYFVLIAGRQLNHRQAVLLQHLISSSNDIERIADHIETIGLLTRTKLRRKIWFDDDSMKKLVGLGKLVNEMLVRAVDSLDPADPSSRGDARELLRMRKEYKRQAARIKNAFNARIFQGAEDAVNGMFYMRYITVFDRIIRHVAGIARAELDPTFAIDHENLEKEVPKSVPIRLAQRGDKGIDESALFVSESFLDEEDEAAAPQQPSPAVISLPKREWRNMPGTGEDSNSTAMPGGQ